MKPNLPTAVPLLALIATINAHSWVHCTAHDDTQILEDMKKAAADGQPVIDPLVPWYATLCHGWPRAKQNPGNWIGESTNYLWALGSADTHACHPNQRTPNQHLPASVAGLEFHSAPAPMATAAAGSSITLMYGGNRHSRGNNAGPGGNPGVVGVYWAGKAGTEIVDVKELTEDMLVHQNGFAEESFSFPADMGIKSPKEGLVDKGIG